MIDLFREPKPDLVFHAAAHKHVNLLERTPREAVLNNILGTRNVARAASDGRRHPRPHLDGQGRQPYQRHGGVQATLRNHAPGVRPTIQTTLVAVRFGNVIGSDGSVLPIFRRQLARGGPLTVTHPEVRRYFMTIPEATQLVIQAALLGRLGDVFILDMGEPVRILDVARQLIRLSGLEPEKDVRIEFIGLRPGEKLDEEILTRDERTRMTRHSKIFRCVLEDVDSSELQHQVDDLIELARHGTRDEVRAGLARLVPEFRAAPLAPLPAGPPEEERERTPVTGLVREEQGGKRVIDVLAASLSLAVLALPAALAWTVVRLSGPSRIVFRREERIGLNRRAVDRRLSPTRVGIDRRYDDRRQRNLPGRPFVTYVIAFPTPERASSLQATLARTVQTLHLDRILYLWSVLKGDMSLVGPSAHLLESDSWQQDEISAWCFARRPGLTGPAQVLGGVGEEALHYDRYYGSHGNWKLDLDALRHALPRLLRPRPTGTGFDEDAGEIAVLSAGARGMERKS